MIRPVEQRDVGALAALYNYYIENTTFTLELEPLTEQVFGERVRSISARYPYLVYEENGEILGYAYLSEFNPRGGYRFTVDLSLYVAPKARGRGIGRQLYGEIEKLARTSGYCNIISLITSENEASLAFHETLGFERVAKLDGIANKFDRWLGLCYCIKRI
jgi:phosphinothricin acetyltransferase